MKTKTINVYEFEELNEKAQEKVLSYFRNKNDYPFLSDELNEILAEKLNKNKIKFDDSLTLYYSLSYCQGDGLCFIGNFTYKKINVKITHNSNYYHNNSSIIKCYDKNGELTDNKTTQKFLSLYANICKEMEKIGYSIIEEENSKEYILENIKANQYTFRENGDIENI